MRGVGHVERMGKKKSGHDVSVDEHEMRRPLGIPTGKREDNIKMDLNGIG
jgi:hypothetical protein